MKKIKVILSLILVAALFVTLFAACAKDNTNANTNTNTNANDNAADPEEIVNIRVSYLDVLEQKDGHERIEAAMNEISEKEIGVHCDLVYWGMGEYVTQAGLAMAGGEQIDAMNVIPMLTFTQMQANTYLLEAKEIYETYCKEAMEGLGQYAYSYTIDGGLYGLPNNRILSNSPFVVMRKDVLEACNLVDAARAADSWSDVEKIWSGVADYCKDNNLAVIAGQKTIGFYTNLWAGDEFSSAIAYENLADGTKTIGVFNDKVECIWEKAEMASYLERVNTWGDNGWIWSDTVLGDQHVDTLMKQGIMFCYLNNGELDIEAQKAEATGYEVVAVQTANGIVSNKQLGTFGISITSTCEDPIATAKWINLLYTNPKMSTLLSWGVEGEDFVLNENGEAMYPDNDPDKAAYHEPDYMMGNQMIVPPWVGNGGDFRARAKADNEAAPLSPYLGLMVNLEGLDTVIASLTSVTEEYYPRMLCGEYSEDLKKEFVDKLYTVGLQDYIDALQAQVDAFVASK